MSTASLFFVPTIVFLLLVAPLWLILHYWTQSRIRRGLSDEERQLLQDSQQTIERLEKRLATLETILDSEHDGWRTPGNADEAGRRVKEH